MSEPNETTQEVLYDSTGRRIHEGDLVRIYHYTNRRRQKVYMYKIVMAMTADWRLSPGEPYLAGVDVTGLSKLPIDAAHKYRLCLTPQAYRLIVADNHSQDICWWERRREMPLPRPQPIEAEVSDGE